MRRITAGGRGPSGGATAARWPLSGLLGVGYVLAMALVITQMITGATRVDSAAGPAMGLFTIAAAGLAARAGGHRRLDRRSRRAWRLISAAFVVLLASYVAFGITTNAGDPLAFPTVGDAIRLLTVPILLTGLLTLPRRTPGVGAGNAKVALDIGMVVAGGAMLLWFLVVGPVLTAGSQPLDVLFFATAYPVSDLALVAGAMLVTMRTTVSSSRRPALLLAAALLVMVVGDVYLSWLRAHAQGTDYAGWQFLCWVTATFLMALAASEKCRHVRFHDDEDGLERTVRPVPYLPYAAVVLGYGLLLAVALRLPMYPYGGLAIGAVTTTALVV
ncbi:MAG TPA: hypothetical protein VES42_08705, partial [Pilimelia sp.]|nr:hypothetical protein [Pilimelia sp.]